MNNYIITTKVLVSYSQCHRKAFLLLFGQEEETPHEYISILEHLRISNRARHIEELIGCGKKVQSYSEEYLNEVGYYLTDAVIKTDNLEAYCDILENPSSNYSQYRPVLMTGTHHISKEQRLELFFAGYVLEKMLHSDIRSGNIVDLGARVHKLNLSSGLKLIKPLVDSLNTWITTPPEPPSVMLFKYCPYCQFFNSCKSVAEKNNELSLLDKLTPKLVKKYHAKGIFTLTHLSFLFKPRRNRKSKKKPKVTYKPELQALAIRTGKIYLQEIPELAQHQTELFLDIEGLPDWGFHYLIGLLICNDQDSSYHFFWAATPHDEESIYRQFLAKIEAYPEAPIYHYGSYESKALGQLATRYQSNNRFLKKRLVNLSTYIYGRIYFPTKSNRLKELGNLIGASWTSQDASGLQSLVWRYRWEETRDESYNKLLIQYNQEDCQAVKLLADEIRKIREIADSHANIDYVEHPKRQATDIGKEIHNQFQTILKLAHTDYDVKKISFQSDAISEKRKRGAQKGHPGYRRATPEAQETTFWSPRKVCPDCGGELILSNKFAERIITDLVFTESGCSRKIIKLKGPKSYCPKCNKFYSPENLRGSSAFGDGFHSWIIYQRFSLRLPYESIIQSLEEQFREKISPGGITQIIRRFAVFYSETDKLLLQRILLSPFIHVDETKVNVQGIEYYVWVLTDAQHVILKMTETREVTLVVELLKGYKGVLVSDFYGGYDSLECHQQKCLVHLIRDLNEDLWKFPFDAEYQEFLSEVKALIVPIIEAVYKHGLNQAFLNGFQLQVESFYEKMILDRTYCSEIVQKYQKRFKRYRESLFTFLNRDGIPWNNNMAERALRHLVVQENISKTFYKSLFPQHLLLLGIMQTCRFQRKSFLKFLLSGEKDVDGFKEDKGVVENQGLPNL